MKTNYTIPIIVGLLFAGLIVGGMYVVKAIHDSNKPKPNPMIMHNDRMIETSSRKQNRISLEQQAKKIDPMKLIEIIRLSEHRNISYDHYMNYLQGLFRFNTCHANDDLLYSFGDAYSDGSDGLISRKIITDKIINEEYTGSAYRADNIIIKKELDRLYQRKQIDNDLYDQYKYEGIYFESINPHEQIYRAYGDMGISRSEVQKEMAKGENSMIGK